MPMPGRLATGLMAGAIGLHGAGQVAGIGFDALEYAALGTNDLDYATVGADMGWLDMMGIPLVSGMANAGPLSPMQRRYLFDQRTPERDLNRRAISYGFSRRRDMTPSSSGMNRNMQSFVNTGGTRPRYRNQGPVVDGSMVFGQYNSRFGA